MCMWGRGGTGGWLENRSLDPQGPSSGPQLWLAGVLLLGLNALTTSSGLAPGSSLPCLVFLSLTQCRPRGERVPLLHQPAQRPLLPLSGPLPWQWVRERERGERERERERERVRERQCMCVCGLAWGWRGWNSLQKSSCLKKTKRNFHSYEKITTFHISEK